MNDFEQWLNQPHNMFQKQYYMLCTGLEKDALKKFWYLGFISGQGYMTEQIPLSQREAQEVPVDNG